MRCSPDDLVEPWVDILDLGGGDILFFRKLARQEFIQNHPGGKNIGPRIYCAGALDNLRSSVIRSPENNALPFSFLRQASQSKVPDLGAVLRIEKNVGGLDVPVKNACLVGVSEAFADSGNKTDNFLFLDDLAMEGFMEGFSIHELHDDVEHVVDLPEVINADKVGMVQLGHGLGLVFEPPAEVVVLPEFAR